MSLEQSLHQRWKDDAALNELLPAERAVTGPARGDLELPYVTFALAAQEPAVRTSSGRALRKLRWRLQLWEPRFEHALQVVQAIENGFGRGQWDFTGGRVLDCQLVSSQLGTAEQGLLRLDLEYLILTTSL